MSSIVYRQTASIDEKIRSQELASKTTTGNGFFVTAFVTLNNSCLKPYISLARIINNKSYRRVWILSCTIRQFLICFITFHFQFLDGYISYRRWHSDYYRNAVKIRLRLNRIVWGSLPLFCWFNMFHTGKSSSILWWSVWSCTTYWICNLQGQKLHQSSFGTCDL